MRYSLRRQLGNRLGSAERAQLEDLVQEACVRLLRAFRRSSVRDVKALERTIAQRTWIDYVRRQERWRRRFRHAGEDDVPASPEAEGTGDDLEERLRFVVYAIFEREGAADCANLARAYFTEMDWKRVGETLDVSHATIRKRWSRCLQTARRVIEADPVWARVLGRARPGEVPDLGT